MKLVSSPPLMRHIISLFTFICFNSQGWASQGALDRAELQKEFSSLSQIKKLSAAFTQVRSVQDWGADITTQGRFSVQNQKSKVIVWEVLKPSYTAMKLTPQGLLYRSSQDQDSPWQDLKNKKVSQQMKSVFSWLSFDLNSINQDFNVFKVRDGEFSLIPKDNSSHFKEIKIFIGQDQLVQKIVMIEPNADTINIAFSKTQVKR